jgi:DUF1680 family protein
LEVSPAKQQEFTLKLRVPGWVQGSVAASNLYSYADKKALNYVIKVNGEVVTSTLEKGYFSINRIWKKAIR